MCSPIFPRTYFFTDTKKGSKVAFEVMEVAFERPMVDMIRLELPPQRELDSFEGDGDALVHEFCDAWARDLPPAKA